MEPAGPFYAPPDPNILWSGGSRWPCLGFYFHQLTEKEGFVRLRKVYIMGLYRK